MSEWVERCITEYRQNRHHLAPFAESIRRFFQQHPDLTAGPYPILHSIRSRLKDESHLRDKLLRKADEGDEIDPADLLTRIRDLAGVRVIHLFQAQFSQIHRVVQSQLDRKDWVIAEDPVAYTWDPETRSFFEALGLQTQVKESFYTSIHYILKPRGDSPLCCELQVRTIFEEAWGEIDHRINYPHPSPISTCREQLRVMSKLMGAATRLADSIHRAHGANES